MLHRNNVQTTSYLGLVSLSHVSIFRSSLLVSYITIFRYVFILITFYGIQKTLLFKLDFSYLVKREESAWRLPRLFLIAATAKIFEKKFKES